MNAPGYSLAVILSGGEPELLYTGLSLLVSEASEGRLCAGLATFRGLELLCDPSLRQRALTPEQTPGLAPAGRDTFARSLEELRETALDFDEVELYACSASAQTMALDVGALDGVLSLPRFMQVTAGARLVAV